MNKLDNQGRKLLKIIEQIFLFTLILVIVGSILSAVLLPLLGTWSPNLIWIIALAMVCCVFWKVRHFRFGLGNFIGFTIAAIIALTLSDLLVTSLITKTANESQIPNKSQSAK